jgi:hypothetical protein
LGWELPLDAFHTNSSFGPGTFPMLPFARDFAKLTNCAFLPLVQVHTSRQLSVYSM